MTSIFQNISIQTPQISAILNETKAASKSHWNGCFSTAKEASIIHPQKEEEDVKGEEKKEVEEEEEKEEMEEKKEEEEKEEEDEDEEKRKKCQLM